MTDALAEARRQLGDGVTVLHTKQYEDSALLGLSRRPVVELLAAIDVAGETPYGGQTPTPNAEYPSPDPSPTGNYPLPEVQLLSRQIADMRHILARMDTPKAETKPRSAAVDRLVRNGVAEGLAESIVSAAASEDPTKIIALLKTRFRCASTTCSSGQSRIALVGPTGSGKTTTAAKLAARAVLMEKKKVALLTLDTYRVGAVEQLATYARILDAPLEVGMCPEDVDALVQKHRDKDLIIIDTVGRSQRDGERLTELADLLRVARPTEVNLAVSAQASQAAQNEAADAFSQLRVDRIIFTKVDECPQPGCALNLAVNTLLPFSYITYGQEVPDDIAPATQDLLARLAWEGSL